MLVVVFFLCARKNRLFDEIGPVVVGTNWLLWFFCVGFEDAQILLDPLFRDGIIVLYSPAQIINPFVFRIIFAAIILLQGILEYIQNKLESGDLLFGIAARHFSWIHLVAKKIKFKQNILVL